MVMISGFLVPRYLSVPDNGIYKLTQLYFQLAYTYLSGYSFFFNFGLNRKGLDRRQLVAVIMRIYFWIAVGSGVLFIASLFMIRVESVFVYVAFALATIPAAVLFTYATKLIQALNEISWLNRLNMVQGLMFLILALVLTFVGRGDGWVHLHLLWLTMVAWLVSWAMAAGFAFVSAVKLAGVSLRPQHFPEIAKMVYPYGQRVAFQQLLTQFNLRGDLMLVGLLAGTRLQDLRAAGLYAVAVTASEVLWHISSSLSLLVYTRIAKEERQHSTLLTARTFRFTLILLIVSALGLAVVFPPIIHFLLKGRYDEAIPAFYVLLIGAVAYGTTALFTQFFTDQLGKVKFPLYMQSASIVTNVILCVVLIPHVYIIGAAIASSAAYYVGLAMNLGYFKIQTGHKIRSLFVFGREDLALLGWRGKAPVEPLVHHVPEEEAAPRDEEPFMPPEDEKLIEVMAEIHELDTKNLLTLQAMQASMTQLRGAIHQLQVFVDTPPLPEEEQSEVAPKEPREKPQDEL